MLMSAVWPAVTVVCFEGVSGVKILQVGLPAGPVVNPFAVIVYVPGTRFVNVVLLFRVRLKPGPATRTGKVVRVVGMPDIATCRLPVATFTGKAVTRP